MHWLLFTLLLLLEWLMGNSNRVGPRTQHLFSSQNAELTGNMYCFLLFQDSALFAELGYFTDTDDLQLDAANETYVSIY